MNLCVALTAPLAEKQRPADARNVASRGSLGRRQPGPTLEENAFLVRDLAHGETLAVLVQAGHVWATLENDAKDHLLSAGRQCDFTGPGRLVLQALEGPAELQVWQ